MELKIKNGDTVRIITKNGSSNNEFGDIGTVENVEVGGSFRVSVKGRRQFGNYHIEEEVELIKQSTEQKL